MNPYFFFSLVDSVERSDKVLTIDMGQHKIYY